MKKILLTFAAFFLVLSLFSQEKTNKMEWWREAKFGMFIHWGVYSVPAGYYQGKPVRGIGEWIMNHGKIPMSEYQKFSGEFNPTGFNADEWVKIAKDAGMKYIVITAKHHDGFAMWPTKVNKWNIFDATPWHHDPLQELAVACRKAGIKLGFYYSQAQDWNNGGAAMGGKWDPAQEYSMDDYIDETAVPQVKELLKNYGSDVPAVLWWDTPANMNTERAKKLYDVVEAIRPGIIMNNRLGGGYEGDTETPEQHIPAQGYPGRNWETCMTINDTWGYKRNDNDWKSTETLLHNLCDIASKGGNYLLNVGPTSKGIIPQPEVERLAQIGRWMQVNGEAIYGTGSTPFGTEVGAYSDTEKDKSGKPKFITEWNWRCTTKSGKLYVIIFNWPSDGELLLPGLASKVTKAFLLADNKSVKFNKSNVGVTLDLPKEAPDNIASVVCVEIADAVAKVLK
ncbi:MAG: alpha-L-fucosidase [Peptostreptococcaceae bacterium]|nr:alpha-L-fucosidase [Peptostreptococcaceae bacterium]